MNFYKDNEDLQYYFERGLDWASLVELTEYFYRAPGAPADVEEAREFYRDILELVGGFVGQEIAPHAETIDREKVSLIDGEAVLPEVQATIFEKIKALELHGMCLPRELGGMNCPLALFMINNELFSRADVSVAAHHGFHGGMALAMLAFSIREGSTSFDPEAGQIVETRFAREIAEICRGEAWGCMDITEPDAGSDMAQLRCVAEVDDAGQWRVTGQKIFITSGHGKYHFVIARTEATADPSDPFSGLAGLSMFLVPTYEENENGERHRIVEIGRLEEKLGHNGSATCSLHFEGAPAHLIGERGEGFRYMLTLMNNARVGVGFECLGLCEAAYRMAREYAAQRTSMGKTIDRHEMIADYLDEMRTDIQGIRALAMHGVYHEEMAQKITILEVAGIPDSDPRVQAARAQLSRHRWEARRVTPLLKYIAAEKAVEHARRCVQIHGGVGYTRDYGAEKLLRDAVVMPIYEGTSQIQALMVVKDSLGEVMRDPGGFIKARARAQLESASARDPLRRRLAAMQCLVLSTQQHLITRTVSDKWRGLKGKPIGEWPRRFLKDWDPKRHFSFAMLHAERFTRMLVDVTTCELLATQGERHPERREVLERYLERAEPRVRYLHDEITTRGDRLLASLAQD